MRMFRMWQTTSASDTSDSPHSGTASASVPNSYATSHSYGQERFSTRLATRLVGRHWVRFPGWYTVCCRRIRIHLLPSHGMRRSRWFAMPSAPGYVGLLTGASVCGWVAHARPNANGDGCCYRKTRKTRKNLTQNTDRCCNGRVRSCCDNRLGVGWCVLGCCVWQVPVRNDGDDEWQRWGL